MNLKIEKINDNQIRCTLTRADLADREIKLSELVCGTEKAKSLFQDMMNQASSEFGFEAEDMPLMIEAIPAPSDSIVLIITKVDDPEELDQKFSKFGNTLTDSENKRHIAIDKLEGAEEMLDLLKKLKDTVAELPKQKSRAKEMEMLSMVRLFSFSALDCVIDAAHLLKDIYHGGNTLYKDVPNDTYILAITKSNHSSAEFNKICNMLTEYGCLEKAPPTVLAFLEEHCDVIVAQDALQQLSMI